MEAPGRATSLSYDLSAQARFVRGRAQRVRLAGLLPGVLLLGVGAWLSLPPYGQSPVDDLAVAAVAAVAGAVLFVLGARSHVPHLVDRLSVTGESLHFHETDGTAGELRWADPAFGLTLVAPEPSPSAAATAPAHVWLALPNGGRGAMPPEVAAEIVQAARAHGLAVLVRRELEPSGRPEVTRIGAPEHSPGWKYAVAA